MKTEFYAGLGANNELIKTIEGVFLPFMPRGEAVEIDGSSYVVRSYILIIEGDEVSAQFRLE